MTGMGKGSANCVCLLFPFALLLGIVAACNVAAADNAVKATFSRAAQFDGDAYVVARDILLGHGESLLPLLEEREDAKEWRERYLAGALRVRICQPEKAVQWRWALLYWGDGLRKRGDGTLGVTLPEEATKAAAAQGEQLTVGDVVVDDRAVPIIVDCLREFSSGSSSRYEHVFEQALVALSELRDPGMIAPMIQYVPTSSREQLIKTLVDLGEPALPAMHTALACAEKPWPQPMRAELAATVLGQIGDESSAKLLLEPIDSLGPRLLPAYCQALSLLQPAEGPEVLFRQLSRVFRLKKDPQYIDVGAYRAIRKALLEFGDAVKGVLDNNLHSDIPIERRVIAAGIAYELAHAEQLQAFFEDAGQEWSAQAPRRYADRDLTRQQLVAIGRSNFIWDWRSTDVLSPSLLERMPAPLVIEAISVTRDNRLIPRLSKVGPNDAAFELLTWLLLTKPARRAAIVPLADVGGAKAIGVYRKFLEHDPLTSLNDIVEGAILIGDRRAGTLLEDLLENEKARRGFETSRRREAAAIKSIADVLNSGPESFAKLLELQEPAYCFAAARVLAGRGDLRCVPRLFSFAVQINTVQRNAQRHATSVDPQAAQRTIVKIGRPAIEAIDRTAKASDAKHARLLAEVLKLCIAQPELDHKVRQALNSRWPGFGNRGGPTVEDYRSAGIRVAELVGENAVPLLEAEIVWNAGRARIAAFALAEFKSERSLTILVDHAGHLGRARQGSIAAPVLNSFGEKGVAAAEKVPPPDPDRAEFDRRRGNHRAVTSTLTLTDNVKGVEGVLAGLKLAAEGKIDANVTDEYLRLAAEYRDGRLVAPIMAAFEKHAWYVASSATRALEPYNDPQLESFYLGLLRLPPDLRRARDACAGLARLNGGKTVARLLQLLHEPSHKNVQIGIMRALAKLIRDRDWSAYAKLDHDQIQRQVPEIRDALLARLATADSDIQAEAADALAKSMRPDDEQAISALLAWMKKNDKMPDPVVSYLIETRDPRVAPVLWTLYLKSPSKRAGLAAYLAALDHKESLKVVASQLQDRLNDMEATSFPEIRALVEFGDEGCNVLFKLARSGDRWQFRSTAYGALARRGYLDAFEPAAGLFGQVLRSGMWDRRIGRIREERSTAFTNLTSSLAGTMISLDPNRAYPLVARACLDVDDRDARVMLARQIRTLELERPELRQGSDPVVSEMAFPGDVANVPLLATCELWLELAEQRRSQLPPRVRDQLVKGGDDTLAVAMELFYQFPVPTDGEVMQAIRNLTSFDEIVRRRATAMLAVREYPTSRLEEAMASAGAEERAHAEAIRLWRHRGGRIHDMRHMLRREFTNTLFVDWPIDQMRRFAIANLDLLATIPNEAYIVTDRPLFPLLLSVRYSPVKAERELLTRFVKKASPAAKKVASPVMLHGFGGAHVTNVQHWGKLPED